MSGLFDEVKFEMFNQILTDYCYELSHDDRENAVDSLETLDIAVNLSNGSFPLFNGRAVKPIINLNLIKVNKTLDLCRAVVNGLYPRNTVVPEDFTNAIYSFNPGVDHTDGIKCGFFEENNFLAFYVMSSDAAEFERSIDRNTQGNRESRENSDPDNLDNPDVALDALHLSSMCNILEGLHGRIAVLERNRS